MYDENMQEAKLRHKHMLTIQEQATFHTFLL